MPKPKASPIKRTLAHLEKASDLLTVAAESTNDHVHVAGLRRLAVGLALLRAPLARIGADLKSGELVCDHK